MKNGPRNTLKSFSISNKPRIAQKLQCTQNVSEFNKKAVNFETFLGPTIHNKVLELLPNFSGLYETFVLNGIENVKNDPICANVLKIFDHVV